MSPIQLEEWYRINRTRVLRHFAGKYGSDPATVEEALQDVMVHFYAKPTLWRKKHASEIERILWKAVDNRLKHIFRHERRRSTIEYLSTLQD